MTEQIPDHTEEELADIIDDAVPSRGYEMTPMVGLGGSAGAFAALKNFFENVPPDSGLVFVVVLHLSPEHESTAAEVLQHATQMPVLQVRETCKAQPNHVYVIPPGKSLSAANGHLRLADFETDRRRRAAVDLFLRSLADSHGPHAAAIVLSGGDGDGALGVKRIKERGGLTIAQDPTEAEFAGMPNAAIATQMVDWVLPAARMAERVLDYFSIEERLRLPAEQAPAADLRAAPAAAEESTLREILAYLRARTGRDFSQYKRATVLRRIARRMQVNGALDLPRYLDCLRTRHGETGALLQDLLITVTNFFRDAHCFEALALRIPGLFAGKGPHDAVRAWVTACASGEEAYSIAMLLAEHARTLERPPSIQVFATDLDQESIQVARKGLYPPTIEADVSEERLRRYFIREQGGFRLRSEIREMLLFATHDVLHDSPFGRLDLVSCRNLLIYLDNSAQARVLQILHFALLPKGLLMLGASESVDESSALFSVLDKKHRLFEQRSAPRVPLPLPVPMPAADGAAPAPAPAEAHEGPMVAGRQFDRDAVLHNDNFRGAGTRTSPWGEVHLRLLEQLAPPSILVDGDQNVVHVSPSAARFLQFSAGEPSRNVVRAIAPPLRIELRAALFQATQSGQEVRTARVPMLFGDETLRVLLRVTPFTEGGMPLALIVVVIDASADDAPATPDGQAAAEAADAEPLARRLDRELERLKAHLRDTVEQYEASTEELKASNEELQAMNEELRSTTEELETSREELQSINEELSTVNLELKSKVDELGSANSDMQNLMDATAIATIFLDRQLRITRYTPAAVKLFNLIRGDIGRPLTDLTPQLRYPELRADAAAVLDKLVPTEREVARGDGGWFLARMLPYRTLDDHIAGVVLSFIDITERRRAEELSRWLGAVVSSSIDAIVSFSLEGRILSWNAGAQRLFGYTPEEAIGKPIALLGDDGQAAERTQLLERLALGTSTENLQTTRRAKDGTWIDVSITASPITDAHGAVVGGTSIVRDVREARRAEESLRRSEERLRLMIENVREYALFSTDLERRIVSWNAGAEHLLGYTSPEALGQDAAMIFTPEDRAGGAVELETATALREGRAADERFHLRKDGTRFWGSGTLMRMQSSSGVAIGFVKVLRDQTEAREAHAALERSQAELTAALQANERARAELQAADAAKDRFLAILSHELRNPLASISNAASVLAKADAEPADRARAARIVARESRAVRALLDDLLDVSRLAVGQLQLNRTQVELAAVIEAAVETVQPRVSEARHELSVVLPQQPLCLQADPLRLTQVLVNLLANAVKYTPPGGRLWLEVEAEDQGLARITVTDNGVGIAAGELERIFELYSQGPVPAGRLNEGLGVGLALVRSIVEQHGGTVEALSEGLGRGSRFVVRLPLAPCVPELAAPAPAAAPTALARQPRVLLVDDHPDAAWSLGKLLQAAGFKVALAGSGAQALELAQAEPPDAMVLDIGMPGLSGLDVAARVRAAPWGRQLALVAVTGWGDEASRRTILESGFDRHLSKPVDPAALVEVLSVLCPRAG